MFGVTRLIDRAALLNARGTASIFQDRELTWPQFADRVARLAGALRRLGLQSGDRVGILSHNSEFYFEYLFAVAWAGGVITPINARLTAAEAAYWLQDSGCSIVFVDSSLLPLMEELRPVLGAQIKHLIQVGDGPAPAGYRSLAEFLDGVEPVADAGRGGDDLFAIYYTGGTTGRSKGVMLTHAGLLLNLFQWNSVIGLGEQDRLLIVAPMFHMVAAFNAVIAALLGASVVIVPRFDPRAVLEVIQRHRVTKAALVPAMIDSLLSFPEVSSYDLGSLRRISYGGAPMPESLLRRSLEVLPQTAFFQIYGQTEGGPNICCLEPQHHVLEGPNARRLRSAGRPLPAVEVGIFDEHGMPRPQGETGEICVRAPALSPGYWQRPEETREARRDGWLRTGDVGYLDNEGFVFIVDRLKDMIVTGGVNVYSAEVENVLHSHPSVRECAVIGVPDAHWGERVHAIVRIDAAAPADADTLRAHCRELLADFKCPRSFEFVVEPLPRNAANKILKRQIRDPYWRNQERKV